MRSISYVYQNNDIHKYKMSQHSKTNIPLNKSDKFQISSGMSGDTQVR